VLYRARSWDDVVFREELDELAKTHGAYIHYLIGQRPKGRRTHPLDARSIARLVPDIRVRDVFICGPDQMMEAVRRAVRSLDVPASQIHIERFAN
jgi:ferredoxin-NADP reductase